MLVLSINLLILKFVSRFDIIIPSKRNKDINTHNAKDYAPLLKVISDGVICISKDRSILFQNVKLSSMLSRKKIQLSSSTDLPKEILTLVETTFASSTSQFLNQYYSKENIFDIKFTPIFKSKDCVSVIVTFKDITETKKVHKLKTELITNISHELKTPLTSIQGYSEMLVENSDKLNDTEKKYLNKILNNSEKLISIYDNLLNLSKVENERELPISEFELDKSLKSSFENLKESFNKKAATLNLKLEYNNLNANKLLFDRVIFNLLENSFKYSKEDLHIEIQTQIEGPNKIIKFKDNGIGIPLDKRDRIFERFYRINESRSSDIKGLGLGLSIVKNIIEKHSGTIQIGDVPSGSLIIIILPS